MKKISLPELFLTFFKIGLFTFGGGYAMIPLIEEICVEQKQWITHDDMMNIAVIAESTPGPIAINCATFVGNQVAGITGALVTTIGVVVPSFAIIYVISMFLDEFLQITTVASAFRGIKIAVGLLIFHAGLKMLKKMKKRPLSCVIFACSAAVMLLINLFSLRFSTISLMLIAGIISFLVSILSGRGAAA